MNKRQQNNKNKKMSNKESKKTSAKSSSKPPKKPGKPRKQSPAEDDIFTAEYIVAERLVTPKGRKNGKNGGGRPLRQFYIKWHGYSDVHNTWEPEQNLLDPTILAEWRELHPLSSTSTSPSEADKSKGLKRKSPASSEEEEEMVEVKDEDEEEEGGEAAKKKKMKKPKTSLRKAPGTPQQQKQKKKKKQWLPKKAKSSSKKKGSAKSSGGTTSVRKSISEQAIATIDVPVSIPGAAAASQPAIIFTEFLMTEPVWHHIHADQARIDHVLDTSGVSSPESADELMA